MSIHLKTLAVSLLVSLAAHAQTTDITRAKFHAGDNAAWKASSFNDNGWQEISTTDSWNRQGIKLVRSYAWYRVKFTPKKKDFSGKNLKYGLNLCIRYIDDADETYLNGVLVGKTGGMPSDKNGYFGAWDTPRKYNIPANSGIIKWDKENVLAIRVYNEGDDGGVSGDPIHFEVQENPLDGIKMGVEQKTFTAESRFDIKIDNIFDCTQNGVLTLEMTNAETGSVSKTSTQKVSVKGKKSRTFSFAMPNENTSRLKITYKDNDTQNSTAQTLYTKYILTPPAPATPRINNALVYGVRPGKPVIMKIAASGDKPMKYSAASLPQGLSVDSVRGVVYGSVDKRGDYALTLEAQNSKGKDTKTITLKVGDKIALTPPMGWNSWNCWGLGVTKQKVLESANAMIEKRLADYGYNYVNIDDGWESETRDAQGYISTNEKFSQMKELGDWLHSHGMKFGIYSSPGDLTCGGYLGSLNHEKQDTKVWNDWGVDYLKYDCCGYTRNIAEDQDKSAATQLEPYLKMERELRRLPRDVFYNVAWGAENVCRWAYGVDGNSWRTTDDIRDTWESISDIGFRQQADKWPFSMPGHWNDPDMLVVGKVGGWGGTLHDSRLTADEQYTHISLWSLLAAPLLIGCDISQIDDFTFNLLCNSEVIAIDQDILGKQAKQEITDGSIQVWKRPLHDGSYAVGIFNLGDKFAKVDFGKYFSRLGIGKLQSARDLWRQQDMNPAETEISIAPHGVKLMKIRY